MKSALRLAAIAFLPVLVGTAHATVTETFKQTYPLAADGTVSVDNVNGDITITGWDKAEVSLEAEKSAKDDEDLKRIELVIEAKPDRLEIKTKYAKKSGWSLFGNNSGSVRYKLMVPAGVRLDKIDSVNSDITVTDVHGPVNLDTVNGRVRATGLMADARLDSVNGNLSAGFVSLDKVDKVKLDSVNGRAEVILPKGASARIDADSVNGGVSVDQAIKLGKTGHHSLKGEIGSGGPLISLDTVNGSIAIREK